YSSIEPGQYTLAGKIAAATDKDLAISSVNATIEDGKYYSFYMSGFYNTTTKTVEGFIVEDNFSDATDFTMATVRFVNAISNDDLWIDQQDLFGQHGEPLIEDSNGDGAE